MKKMTGIVALGLAFVLLISLAPVSAGPALFTGKDKNGVEFKPFIFMPVAKYMPPASMGIPQVEGHHQYFMTNNTAKPRSSPLKSSTVVQSVGNIGTSSSSVSQMLAISTQAQQAQRLRLELTRR